MPNGVNAGNVIINGNTFTGTFDVNGTNRTINALISSGTATNSIVDNTLAATSSTLSIGGNNASGTFGGVIRNTDGTLGITKIGNGTQTLSGANAYTGAAKVDAGTLPVTGSLSASSAVTVGSGATLGGTRNDRWTRHNPGRWKPRAWNKCRHAQAGALALNATSLLSFELSTPGVTGGRVNDLVSITGNFTLDGMLAVTELSALADGTYPLFSYPGTLTENVLDLQPSLLTAHPGSYVDTAVAGTVNLVLVPEPSAVTILAGGLGTVLAMRRRRTT